MTTQDSYSNIRRYVSTYADIIAEKGPLAAPTVGEDVFAVLMEKWDVERLLSHPDCYRLAAMIGIDDDEKITVSLLAVNEDGEVLPEHLRPANDPNTVQGEEVWPYRKTLGEWEDFLPEV